MPSFSAGEIFVDLQLYSTETKKKFVGSKIAFYDCTLIKGYVTYGQPQVFTGACTGFSQKNEVAVGKFVVGGYRALVLSHFVRTFRTRCYGHFYYIAQVAISIIQ